MVGDALNEERPLDLLGVGCASVDDLVEVDGFPQVDGKQTIAARARRCGGLTSTALMAAVRLGATGAYAGILGDDDLSELVLQTLAAGGVDTSAVLRREGAGPVYSLVIVDRDTGTRSILRDHSRIFVGVESWPPTDLVRRARVLLVDYVTGTSAVAAARAARAAGIPVVLDVEETGWPGFDELLELADHLVISAEFAHELTGEASPERAALELRRKSRVAVVVTCGAGGAWYLERGSGAPSHQSAFRVAARNTTGCGDVFHGAYGLGLARGMEIDERVRFAQAAAALTAASNAGDLPDLGTVQHLISNQVFEGATEDR